MANQEEFRKATKPMKHKQLQTEIEVLKTSNTYGQLPVDDDDDDDDDDDEVTFKVAESNSESEVLITGIDPPQSSSTTKDMPLNEQNKESSVTVKDVPSRDECSREATVSGVVKAIELQETEQYATNTKEEKVYLIGDSISGQVNPALLGNSTKTFVQKLKASTIQDICKITDQVKDAKMIIVHTGINNIRQHTSDNDNVSDITKALDSLRDKAPDW